MKLVIPGGNGFIGQQICRIAVRNGHDVIAFGRSGKPSKTPVKHPWVGKVEWHAADVFDVEAWRPFLDGADAVVHCVATIAQDPERGVTFDRVNGESTLLSAEAASEADVPAFVYLSVREKPPLVSGRFLASKHRPDREIPDRFPDLRFVSLQPNLVFGDDRPGSSTMAALLGHMQPWCSEGYGSADGRPLPVELVAATAVHAAATPTLEGRLSVNQIDDLGRTCGLLDGVEVAESSLGPLLLGLGATAAGTWWLRRRLRGSG